MAMCNAATLMPGDKAPWDVRRGPVDGEPAGTNYVTTWVQVKVAMPCTGGDWQVSMAPAGAEWVRIGHAGDGGPFGPYSTGQILTFGFSWPEASDPESETPAHVQINGFDMQVVARGWPHADTTWTGPTLGEPTATFAPPAS